MTRKIVTVEQKQLQKWDDITEQARVLEWHANGILERYPKERPQVRCPTDLNAFMKPFVLTEIQECLWVLSVDTRNHILNMCRLYIGTVNNLTVRCAEVLRPPIMYQAAAIFLVHNHPSGIPTPSSEDLNVTIAISRACKIMDIEFIDHVIICPNGKQYSIRENNPDVFKGDNR